MFQRKSWLCGRGEAIGNENAIALAVANGDIALLEWSNEEIDTLNEKGFIAEACKKSLALPCRSDINPVSVLIIQYEQTID